MRPLRVLLVDGNPEYLDAASYFLTTAPGIEVVGRARSGREALEQVSRLHPEVVLMELFLPEMTGLAAAAQIKALPDAPRVVFVSSRDEAPYRAEAEAAHMDGFVSKMDFCTQVRPLIEKFFE